MACGLGSLCRGALVCLSLVAAAAAADLTREVLAAGDECAASGPGSGEGSGCALNEMQLRAGKVAKAAEAQTAGLPMLHPLYCAMLMPGMQSPLCMGQQSTCGCQAYCATQPDTSKGWDATCCGCPTTLAPNAANPPASPAYPAAAYPYPAAYQPYPAAPPGSAAYPASPPAWGAYPAGPPASQAYPAAAPGYQPYPAAYQPYRAAPAVALVAPGPAATPAATPPGGPRLRQPQYCAMLPPGVQSPYCLAAQSTCSCQPFCATQPDSSKGWDPSCCGCR